MRDGSPHNSIIFSLAAAVKSYIVPVLFEKRSGPDPGRQAAISGTTGSNFRDTQAATSGTTGNNSRDTQAVISGIPN